MKSKKLLVSLLAVSMIASVVLVGCGSKDGDKAGTDGGDKQQEANMDKDQYLNVFLKAEPKTIDQSKSTDLYSSQILSNVQEGLTRIIQDENGKDKIVEGAAKEWKTSDDGLTWTFSLRDMKWSDGQPVKAEDFVYGIKRTLDQSTASQYAFLLAPIKNAVEFNGGTAKAEDVGVKALDDKTVEFTLHQPCPYFLDLTYFKVMQPQRKDFIEQKGDKYGTEPENMLYTGPFVISEWVHQNQVVLTKNPEYWDKDSVKLEKVTMKIIKDENAQMNEMLTGALDVGPVSDPNWITKLDETGNFDIKKGYDGSTTYTFFNTKNKLFSNEKIRKAFAVAEDREGEIKTLRKGLAEPALAWCPPAVQVGGKDFRETADSLPVQQLIDENKDPKALFVEGLKELGMDPDPSKVTIKYLASGTTAKDKEWSEYRQQNYKEKLGINVECEYTEWAIFQKRTDDYDYEIASMAWGGDYNDPNTFFDMWLSTSGVIPTGWGNEEYDKLIEEANKEEDQAKRIEMFKKAEKILIYDDTVVSPGAWRFKNTFIRNFIKNYSSPLFGTPDFKYTYTQGRK